MNRKDWLILLAGLLIGAGLGIFLYFGLGFGNSQNEERETFAGRELVGSPSIGLPAPNFELKSLKGDLIRLSDLQGKIILINFWATWCAPCRLEMASIQARADRYPTQLEVLAVNYDEPQDLVQSFVDELNLKFNVLLDPGAMVQSLYRVRGYPTTFLVDESGVVRFVHIGILTEDQLDRYLQDLGVGG